MIGFQIISVHRNVGRILNRIMFSGISEWHVVFEIFDKKHEKGFFVIQSLGSLIMVVVHFNRRWLLNTKFNKFMKLSLFI